MQGRADNAKLDKGTQHVAWGGGRCPKRVEMTAGAKGSTDPCSLSCSLEHRGNFYEFKEKCKLFNPMCPKCGKLVHSKMFCHKGTSKGTAVATGEASASVEDLGKVVTMTGVDGIYCRLFVESTKMQGGNLTHYAVDQLGN